MRIYIDPGTGSMLFTVLIGLVSAGIYALRGLLIKLRFSFGAKDQKTVENDTIPFVIYSDDKRYWNVFKPICDEFEKRKTNLVYMSQSKDDPAFDEKYEYIKTEFIGEGNKGFAKLNLLKADVVLATTPGLDVYQWKRSKNVKHYSHILHAADDATAYRMFGLDYFDSVLLSGQFQVDELRKLEKLRKTNPKDLKIVGLTYFDEMDKKVKAADKVNNEKTNVLLAPSWGESSILNKYGSKAIKALLDTGYHVIVRPHPQSYKSEKEMLDKLQKEFIDAKDLEWNNDNNNFDVLNKADILISDFSGVMFDFALVFDKPIIYADTSFDKSPYDAWWLEDEMWKFEVLPKLGEQLTEDNLSNIKELIDKCLTDSKYENGREEARSQTWCNRGNAASTIVEYLISKRKEIAKE